MYHSSSLCLLFLNYTHNFKEQLITVQQGYYLVYNTLPKDIQHFWCSLSALITPFYKSNCRFREDYTVISSIQSTLLFYSSVPLLYVVIITNCIFICPSTQIYNYCSMQFFFKSWGKSYKPKYNLLTFFPFSNFIIQYFCYAFRYCSKQFTNTNLIILIFLNQNNFIAKEGEA